jgi:ATP-dependent helicase HrpB
LFLSTLPIEIQNLLQKLPFHIKVPSGSEILIQYEAGKNPFIEVRIQELFGWETSPQIMDHFPLVIHLLGPNYKPMQVTADLKSFWSHTYSEVRKELRLKYPKHQWPEDPSKGTPEAKGRRRH